MIGFMWQRGNVLKEQASISVGAESELQGIDLYKIRKVYERVRERQPKLKFAALDKIYIYILIDPRDFQVRYVGKTNNLKERMIAHI
jgi:hypothetical protein